MSTSTEATESFAELAAHRLELHLRSWLGSWPPVDGVVVVGAHQRVEPGWDGRARPVLGVSTPFGSVLSVAPPFADAVAEAVEHDGLESAGRDLGALVGLPGQVLSNGFFRSCKSLVELPEIGEWVEPTDRRVPEWLRPFNGGVLLATDAAGRYIAGVGCKEHDEIGTELAVGTEPEHRGRGLARDLVAQAARDLFARGRITTYLHAPDNYASAKVAEASGFPDEGWRVLGLRPATTASA